MHRGKMLVESRALGRGARLPRTGEREAAGGRQGQARGEGRPGLTPRAQVVGGRIRIGVDGEDLPIGPDDPARQ